MDDQLAGMDGPVVVNQKPSAAGKVRIFHAAAAAPLDEVLDVADPPEAVAGMAQAMESGMATGATVRVLYKSPVPGGLSLVYAWFKGDFPLPRHSHNADCLYYIVSGELRLFGRESLGPGDVFFIPANAVYSYVPGPEGVEVLEIRNATRFDVKTATGTPEYWKQIIDTCVEKQASWRGQRPPSRAGSGLG